MGMDTASWAQINLPDLGFRLQGAEKRVGRFPFHTSQSPLPPDMDWNPMKTHSAVEKHRSL